MKSKSSFKEQGSIHVILISLVILALIGGLGYMYWKNFLQPKPETNNVSASTQHSKPQGPDATEMTNLLVQQIKDKSYQGISDIQPDNSVNFIWTEGTHSTVITTSGYTIHLVDKNSKGFGGAYQAFAKYPDLAKLYSDSETLAKSKGFTLNQQTIQNTIGDSAVYIEAQNRSTAFSNENAHCTISSIDWTGAAGTDSTYNINLSCIDNNDFIPAQALQNQLVDAFAKAHNISDPKTILYQEITVDRQEGDYIQGSSMGARSKTGGGYAVFRKVNGQWRFLYGGQSIPDCAEVDSQGVPKDFNTSCEDSKTNNVRQAI